MFVWVYDVDVYDYFENARLSIDFMYIRDVIENMEATPETVLVVLSATVLIVIFAVIALFIKSRNQLNWYEQNVLDLGYTPMRLRCPSFTRTDTEETTVSDIVEQGSPSRPFREAATLPIPKGDLTNLFMIPTAKNRPRSMFSKLHSNQFDRGMYQFPMGDESACSSVNMVATGSIQICVSHDANLNLLTITLRQAIDLPSKREDDNPNPYMRVTMEIPEQRKPAVEHQTKTFMATASPTINEDFFFSVPADQIAQCRLEIMVYDFDQFSVDECIGYCWLTLGRLSPSFEHNTPTVFWAEVLPYEDNESGYGQILFSLAYLSHAQRLTMNIFKVRNIKTKTDGNICLRVTLYSANEKPLKKKKTSSKKCGRTVHFNECLTFSVPKHSLCDVFLLIELSTETGTFLMASRTVARMFLPIHKCKDLWRAIIREEKSQARWYSLEAP
ncbi:unnamed protein product [Caenorhabditis bovis]|uniref:C2 domain-containing protein n=1 Tax=Caenorhabditis bovis TaxID=2654633 RepID=A0A8S1ED99_9PELO|nr:unnamed protein product [Caenorhabditis bovis]